MTRYLLQRLGQALLVLLGTFTGAFLLLQALPGDAVMIKFMNPDMGLTAAQIADIRASYGADSPIWLQYLHSLGNFLTGDFGYSVQAGVPVSDLLRVNLGPTVELSLLGFAAAVLLALAVVVLANAGSLFWLRAGVLSLPSLFISVPVFWLGIMLIQVFSFQLGLVSVISPGPVERLVLPVLTLAIPISAPLAQILMRNVDEVLTQPFVAVVRAKGASRGWVLWRHVARNAMLPTLTIAGVLFGELLGGAVVTEAVFGLNGLGGLTQQAVGNHDTAVLQAIVVISATAFVLINLVVDLLYPVLDPRLAGRGDGPREPRSRPVSTGEGVEPGTRAGLDRGPWRVRLRRVRLRRVRPGLGRLRRIRPDLALAWLVIVVVLLWAVAPGMFTGYSGTEGVAGQQLKPPGALHVLGTDGLGRDVYARIVYGAVHSLSGAFVAVTVGLLLGTLLGLVAGSRGGWTDAVIMRLVDMMLSIPSLLLSLSIIVMLGFGTINVAIAVGAVSVARFARLTRSEVVRVRRSDYVEAAFGSGGAFFAACLWRHVLPNSLTSVIALAALQFGTAILSISTLGFLGYGAPPPTPEWGLLIAEGRNYISSAWWLTTFPGIMVVLVVLAANRISLSIRTGTQ